MLGDYELLGLILKGDKEGVEALLKKREEEAAAHAEELNEYLKEHNK